MYQPENMKKWKLESDYGGEDYSEWYILVVRTRGSDNIENSNFERILEDLGENASAFGEKSGLLVARFGHWACGWIESLMVHESDEELLIKADKIAGGLKDYPLYDDDDYSNREFEDFNDNIEQAVKDFENDNNLDFTDEQKSMLCYYVGQNSNECASNTWPSEDEISKQWEIVQSSKTCPTCKTTYDTRSECCDCQVKMF